MSYGAFNQRQLKRAEKQILWVSADTWRIPINKCIFRSKGMKPKNNKNEGLVRQRKYKTNHGIINVKSIFMNKIALSDVLLKLAEKRMKY